MSYGEDWAAGGVGHAHRIDVLARTLREMAAQVVLPDPQPRESDEVDQDPLSPESLGAQTRRLLVLIERARDQNDVSLLHSLRRELLLTRWALAKLPPSPSRAAAEKQAVPRARKIHCAPPSDHRTRVQHLGRRSEASPVYGPNTTISSLLSPEPRPRE